eukprot:365832-Chlamydomonas_euryale.AAC.1
MRNQAGHTSQKEVSTPTPTLQPLRPIARRRRHHALARLPPPAARTHGFAAALCDMNWIRLVSTASVSANENVWLMLRDAAVAAMPMMPACGTARRGARRGLDGVGEMRVGVAVGFGGWFWRLVCSSQDGEVPLWEVSLRWVGLCGVEWFQLNKVAGLHGNDRITMSAF